MANDKPEELTRRDFISLALGSALVAGIGCGSDEKTNTQGGNGGAGTTASSAGGGAATNTSGQGGGVATNTSGQGGASTTPSANGGATASGGASSTGGVASTSSVAGGTALVTMVRNSDVIKATMDAIAGAGGLPDLSGKVVLLKVNAIDKAPPGSVSPDVVRGVIRAVKAKGTPSKIVVADDAFTGALATLAATNGIGAATTGEGATLLDLKSGKTTSSLPAGATASLWSGGGIPMYSEFLSADYVINVAVCKTHGNAVFSMAMKNWYGAQTNTGHNHNNVTILGNAMAEIHLARKENFVVLDATQCLLTGGPQVGNGKTASPGIVVASADAIAVDVTGLCILKHYLQTTGTSNTRVSGTSVWAQSQVAHAMELSGLGWLTSKQNFPYAAVGIDEAATIMAYRET